jgi:GntR family transcriptional repressor for pyruvate dehydrogenase complex
MVDPFNNHTNMMTKSSPRRSPRSRPPSLNGQDRASDHRAAASPAPVKFRPIHARRAFEEICQRIREQLALGVLKPGDKLPPERDLAQQLGVSRNVLREALRSLEMAGVLRLQKGVKGGAFIQEGDTRRMNEVMRDMLSLGTISLTELSEARIQVIDLVVRLACERARQADFQALEANIERTDLATREGRLLDRVECSREFYKLLALATGNKVIAMMMDSVTEIHMRFVYAKVASSGAATPRLAEKRRQFVSALRARRFRGDTPDAGASGIRPTNAGVRPGRHVAACSFGGDAARCAPLNGVGHARTESSDYNGGRRVQICKIRVLEG